MLFLWLCSVNHLITASCQVWRGVGADLKLIGIFNKQVSEQLHFVVEEFDRRLSVGDILVILGPSREMRAFKKDVENAFCKI